MTTMREQDMRRDMQERYYKGMDYQERDDFFIGITFHEGKKDYVDILLYKHNRFYGNAGYSLIHGKSVHM